MPTTISAKDVMKLRETTGLGMMECKAALAETDGDLQKAIDLLRTKLAIKMDSRSDRTSAEGAVATALTPDRSRAAIVEVNTETDFTARNEAFIAMTHKVAALALADGKAEVHKTDAVAKAIDEVRLTTKENIQFARGAVIGAAGNKVGSYVHFNNQIGAVVEVTGEVASVSDEFLKELCQHIVAATPSPIAIDESGVPADIVAKEKEIAKAQAIEQGKPEAIAEKMVVGKIRKFYEDHCLNLQLFIKDDKKRIKEILPKGVSIKSFVRYQVGSK